MSLELRKKTLKRLEDPIRITLKTYQSISDNGLEFDTDKACYMDPTPDKPNSARSETDVNFQGDQVGKLYVIAFQFGDGTGSEVNYKLDKLSVPVPYPRESRIVPRDKTGVHSEAHLTILRYNPDNPHAEPHLYLGMFELLGLEGNKVKKIGYLGHKLSSEIETPLATFTVGYRGSERFGDPHAVYSRMGGIQVCGFFAVSDKVYRDHPDIWSGLNPQYPTL